MAGDTPTPPKPPIDKAYSIASIKACIPTPLDLDKLNYNSWSSLFQRFCKTYEVHHHLAAPSTTATSTVDPLHDTNDSLVVMWIYATISPKLVEMIVDVDSTAHGVWNRLKDLFHDNKDARITQLDNEIRNMAIGNLSITDFFQQLKSKADRLANLESPVKDTSLVTYAINGVRSKYPDAARVIRLREKAPTFDELRSLMLLEESDMSNSSHGCGSPNLKLLLPADHIRLYATSCISDNDTSRNPLGILDTGASSPCREENQRSSSGLFLFQSKFAEEILERAHMQHCNPCRTPVDTESKLGSDGDPVCDLPYTAVLQRILRYVRGTLTFGLQIHASTTAQLTAYTDADWAGCPRYSCSIRVTLSRSSAEAEYRGVANVVAETAWIRNFLLELHAPLTTATLVYCDNVSAVYLTTNPVKSA
ncbi:WRKY family transcription factor [Tanacetum coccineum]